MKPLFLPFFILFVIWLTVKLKMSYRKEKQIKETFLENEVSANQTRKKSLDDLDYITIPLNKLPFCSNASDEILAIQETVKSLSEKKIVNLTGISNTDLKQEYGAANLERLMEYDKNFTDLSRTLYTWGEALYNNGSVNDAVTVLEFAVECKSDISKIYILLANIYSETSEKSKINELIESAGSLNSLMKNPIIRSLEKIITE